MEGRGHHTIHYGHEYSNLPCGEHVTVLSNEVWEKVYGEHDYKSKFFTYNTEDEAYQTFYKNAIEEIEKRKQPNDFILPFWGSGVKAICDAHPDLITVEPGIGYPWGIWSQWKVFESYAIYHAYCSLHRVAHCEQDWYEVVIPNYFDLDEFEYCGDKENYFLYVGRVFNGKGVNIAIQATEKLGVKLKVAGQLSDDYPNEDSFPPHVEYVGYVGVEERKQLMQKALGSFLPSMYVEPFGGVQIENLLCGTPTITTDWGAFAENNIEGVTGYRCRTFNDFVEAARKCLDKEIDYKVCRKHGEKFSLENIAPRYEKYFQDILNVYEKRGWYESNKPRVLIWSESKWALGRIHWDLKSYLGKYFDIDFIDWGESGKKNIEYFTESWKHYDLILGTPEIYTDCERFLDHPAPKELVKKCVPIVHSPFTMKDHFFSPVMDNIDNSITHYGINSEICEMIEEKIGGEIKMLPIGVNTREFRPFKKVTKIKKIGFIGDNQRGYQSWEEIKRSNMFEQICQTAGIDYEFIHSKSFMEGPNLYKDIDLVINTSVAEGLPTPFAECVACKIPFISTKVGIVPLYDKVLTFETVEEAVDIIKYLNSSPEVLSNYVEELYNQVIPERNWEYVVEKYWLPELKSKLNGA
jgi:glycosyltransferase involved in cell wall biosynthesis